MNTPTADFPWFATNEKQFVRIVEPRQTMGGWPLCENAEGQQWFIPQGDLEPASKHRVTTQSHT